MGKVPGEEKSPFLSTAMDIFPLNSRGLGTGGGGGACLAENPAYGAGKNLCLFFREAVGTGGERVLCDVMGERKKKGENDVHPKTESIHGRGQK